MRGLGARIHVFLASCKDVYRRDKPGHDDERLFAAQSDDGSAFDMIVELGHFALILGLLLALLQASLPLVGAARGNLGWMAVGQSTALAQLALIALAFAALAHAYVTSD